jgi:hypothetical protein
VTHQVYARSSPFLFFFKIFLEAYLSNALVILDDERIPIAVIFGVLTSEVIVA